MKLYKIIALSLIITGFQLSSYAAVKDTTSYASPANLKFEADTTAYDSISADDQQESVFQDYLDSMYVGVDTFAWDNKMINSGRFDSKDMKDTVRIIFNNTNSIFVLPFKNYVTCGFGPRRYGWHYGTDIKVLKGDTILAAMEGVVRVTKYDRRGFGKVVVVRHLNGLETIYGHLSKVLVEPNQRVKAGEVIGLGGNTGHSTGSHLHFETRYLGEPFDPNCFVDFANNVLKTDTLKLSYANFDYLVEIRKAKYCNIRKGDSLGRIAMRYHTSVTKLCKLNGISRKTLLRVGRKLRYQ